MTWKPPFREGITQAEHSDDIALCCDDKLRAARSLKELTADWAFFTVGCLYTFGGLDCNLLSDFTQTHEDPDCTIMTILASRPLFTGICPPGYPEEARRLDYELGVVPLEYWDQLLEWIAQVSMVDRRRSRFARATVQEIDIVDYLAVNHTVTATAKPPTIPIVAFGIDGTHHHVAFAPQTTSPHDTARVIKLPIREETRRFGQAILAYDPNPFVPVELKAADPADVVRKIQEVEEKGT